MGLFKRVVISSQRSLPTQPQQTQDPNTSAVSRIRTHGPKSQVAADRRLRPHGQRRRLIGWLVYRKLDRNC